MTVDFLAAVSGDATINGVSFPVWVVWIIVAASVVVAGHTLWAKIVKPISRAIKVLHDQWALTQEQNARLTTLEERSAELVPNSGTSLRDAVDRIERLQTTDSDLLHTHLLHASNEFTAIWKQIASRDVVQAADTAAQKIERGEG